MPEASLDAQPCGRPLRIVAVDGDRASRRRLLELGFLPGTDVTVVRKGALAGVVELEVRCGRFTVGLDQARRIRATER